MSLGCRCLPYTNYLKEIVLPVSLVVWEPFLRILKAAPIVIAIFAFQRAFIFGIILAILLRR
jgi:hypothetical protein